MSGRNAFEFHQLAIALDSSCGLGDGLSPPLPIPQRTKWFGGKTNYKADELGNKTNELGGLIPREPGESLT